MPAHGESVARHIGRRLWANCQGHVRSVSTGDEHAFACDKTACILNAIGRDAHAVITLYFADRVTAPARRTPRISINDLGDHEPAPRDTDYFSVLELSARGVVQHGRLDLRWMELSLLTIAYRQEAPSG